MKISQNLNDSELMTGAKNKFDNRRWSRLEDDGKWVNFRNE